MSRVEIEKCGVQGEAAVVIEDLWARCKRGFVLYNFTQQVLELMIAPTNRPGSERAPCMKRPSRGFDPRAV